MNPDLEKLIELERADREIGRLKQEVAALPARMAAIEQRLARSQAQLDSAHARIKDGDAAKRKLEGDIQALQQKISKYREQSLDGKTKSSSPNGTPHATACAPASRPIRCATTTASSSTAAPPSPRCAITSAWPARSCCARKPTTKSAPTSTSWSAIPASAS